MIKPLQKEHAAQVAQLHITGISTGFISSLGFGFVTSLYEAIAEDKNSFGFVAVEKDKVLGFVTFSRDLGKLYKFVIFKKGLRFGFILIKKAISLQSIKKIWANIFYPKKMQKMNLPDAELLSIVVAAEDQGKGIARQLIEAGLDECRKTGLDKVKVLVAAENKAANQLYRTCGFEHAAQIDSHGIVSNIYVADTGFRIQSPEDA
jgi:ribosomal protein S18 acetylase RimI-like enzyme